MNGGVGEVAVDGEFVVVVDMDRWHIGVDGKRERHHRDNGEHLT